MDSSDFLFLLLCLFILLVFIALCMIPTSMAKKRGRSQFGWFLFSFLFSPILGMIILAFLGETEEKRKERIMEEVELRQLMERKYIHQETIAERKNNPSGRTINDIYKR